MHPHEEGWVLTMSEAYNVQVECPYCGHLAPVPAGMSSYKWKHDDYAQSSGEWFCWNCGEKLSVKVTRRITQAEIER